MRKYLSREIKIRRETKRYNPKNNLSIVCPYVVRRLQGYTHTQTHTHTHTHRDLSYNKKGKKNFFL